MGGVLQKGESPKASILQTKLKAKITEAMQGRESEGSSMKSCNSVILKFPKIDESLRKCKATFQDFDEDGNDTIDPQELKHCFRKLEMNFLDEEINNLFEARNINADMGLKFNEFIVLLCLVYLLTDDPAALHAKSRMSMPNLEATFETLVDAFVFLDKEKDGHVRKKAMIQSINETNTGEVVWAYCHEKICLKALLVVVAEEMDWERNGMVNFKEFLLAFTRWVGIEDNEDEDGEEGA